MKPFTTYSKLYLTEGSGSNDLIVGISYLFDTMHCSFTVSDITTPSLLDTNVPL